MYNPSNTKTKQEIDWCVITLNLKHALHWSSKHMHAFHSSHALLAETSRHALFAETWLMRHHFQTRLHD
jgi:hypothetical protein